MTTYYPPSENLTEFNPKVFEKIFDDGATITEAKKYFLRTPFAQGKQTFSNLAINGAISTDFNNSKGLSYGFQSNLGASGSNHNTGYGYRAGGFQTTGTGSGNSALGSYALHSFNKLGNSNTAVGSGALWDITTGSNNTAIGQDCLIGLTTGSNNTGIGRLASVSNFSNSTAIGRNATATASNQVVLGTTSTAVRTNVLRPFLNAFSSTTDIGYTATISDVNITCFRYPSTTSSKTTHNDWTISQGVYIFVATFVGQGSEIWDLLYDNVVVGTYFTQSTINNYIINIVEVFKFTATTNVKLVSRVATGVLSSSDFMITRIA